MGFGTVDAVFHSDILRIRLYLCKCPIVKDKLNIDVIQTVLSLAK